MNNRASTLLNFILMLLLVIGIPLLVWWLTGGSGSNFLLDFIHTLINALAK